MKWETVSKPMYKLLNKSGQLARSHLSTTAEATWRTVQKRALHGNALQWRTMVPSFL